jgi:hypothetical protein
MIGYTGNILIPTACLSIWANDEISHYSQDVREYARHIDTVKLTDTQHFTQEWASVKTEKLAESFTRVKVYFQ